MVVLARAVETIQPAAEAVDAYHGAVEEEVVNDLPGHLFTSIELEVLGGYGVSRVQPTLADRAIDDLKAHLEEWKRHQPVAD